VGDSGVVGGIHGIGGGSLVSPILVGRGVPVNTVAPAALTSTFITAVAGAMTYLLLAISASAHDIAPDWTMGLCVASSPPFSNPSLVRRQLLNVWL
jgi:uncharacterized protein